MGQTPLFVAAYTRKREVTTVLVNQGADPNVRCFGGYTAMHGACYSGSVRILGTLLKFGGDLSIHDVHRQTARYDLFLYGIRQHGGKMPHR